MKFTTVVEVEAVRWEDIDRPPPGIETGSTIIFSKDEKMYYINRPGSPTPTCWLSSDKKTGDAPVVGINIFQPGVSAFLDAAGKSWWRTNWPFTFFEVKSGRREPISEDAERFGPARSELFKDYAASQKWKEGKPESYSIPCESICVGNPRTPDYVSRGGRHMRDIRVGDWLVTSADGRTDVWGDEDFRRAFPWFGPASRQQG